MDAQIKIFKAVAPSGLLAAAGVLLVRMIAPTNTLSQLAAAAIGGLAGAMVAANIK